MPVDPKTSAQTNISSWRVAEHTSPLNWKVGNDQTAELQKSSASLTKVLANQRQAVKELAQINQLRSTLKKSVISQIETSLKNTLAEPQLRALLDHRGTQAELDHIINPLTLTSHQDIIYLTDKIAQKIIASSDHRLQLLARLATKDVKDGRGDIQQNLTESIKQDAKAELAMKLIEAREIDGQTTSQIEITLKAVTLVNQSGRPRIIGVNKAVEDDLTAALLTRQSLTEDDANQLVDEISTRHQFAPSPEEKNKIVASALAADAAYSKNVKVTYLRSENVAGGVTAPELADNLAVADATPSDLVDGIYGSEDLAPSAPSLPPDIIDFIDKVINEPSYLSEHPAEFQQFIEAPQPSVFWPEYAQPEYYQPEYYQENAGSNFQVGGGGFFNQIRSTLGNGGSFPGGGGANPSGFGKLLGKVFPKLGGGAATTGALAGSSTTAAAAAAGGATAGWPIATIIIGIILVIAIIYMLAGASPQKAAMSQIDYISGAGGGGGPVPYDGPIIEIDIAGQICWPVMGTFRGWMPEYHPTVSANQSAIDIGNAVGTPIMTPFDGTIIFSGWDDSGYGNFVKLTVNLPTTGGGTDSCNMYFGHMSQITLPSGTTTVSAGTQLGLLGSTGNSTGPHLHWGITCSSGKPNIRDIFPPVDRDVQFDGRTSVLCEQK